MASCISDQRCAHSKRLENSKRNREKQRRPQTAPVRPTEVERKRLTLRATVSTESWPRVLNCHPS